MKRNNINIVIRSVEYSGLTLIITVTARKYFQPGEYIELGLGVGIVPGGNVYVVGFIVHVH